MKGRNICLQSRKHQKKHTRSTTSINSPCLLDKPPNFRVTAFLEKKNQPSSYLEPGENTSPRQVMNFLDFGGGFFSFFFQRLFPEGPTKNRGLKRKWDTTNMVGCLNDVHQLLSDLNVGFKWCSPTIECSPIHFFPRIGFHLKFGPGPKFPRLLGSILGLCDGLWHLRPLVQRLSKFLFRVGHVRMIFRAILDDFWEVTREHWWVDEIDMTWFWFLRDGKDDFAGKSEVYVVYAHGEIIIDFQRIFQTVGLEIFFRSIDDGFKFWTPKIISSRAQE